MKHLAVAAGLLTVLATASSGARAQEAPESGGAVRPGWYTAVMYSHMLSDSVRLSGDGYGASVAIGHHGKIASVELAGLYYAGFKHGFGEPSLAGGQLSLILSPFHENEVLSRFVGIVGFGAFKETDIKGRAQDGSGLIGDAGVGYLQPLQMFGLEPLLRFEVRTRYDYQMPPREDWEPAYFRDWLLNVGLQFPLSPKPPPPPPPEPPKVVPPVTPPPPAPKCEQPQAGQPISLEGCKAGDVLVLPGVNFALDKADLDPNATTILDPAADALNQHAELKVEISGHTDSSGSDAHNRSLSERRAEAVRSYLVSQGVTADRLTAAGYGESQPIDSNDTDEGRGRNRRVELRITEATAPAPTTPEAPAAESAAQPADPTAQPAAESAAPAPAESTAPEPPAPPP